MRSRDIAKLILRAGPLIESYRRRHRGRFDTPLVFSFLVTSRCTLRCSHCFYHATDIDRSEELTLDEYRRLSEGIDDFAVGLFCGGEPFMRKDLSRIVNIFRRNNRMPLAGAATNGQLTSSIVTQTESILRADRSSLFNLGFSIDGFRDVHDEIRGEGTFDRAIRSFRECQKLAAIHPNLALSVTTVVNSKNQDSAAQFVRWTRENLSPSSHAVLLVRQSPRGGDSLKRVRPERYYEAQREALREHARSTLSSLGQPHNVFIAAMASRIAETMVSNKRCFTCHAGRHGTVVDPRGEVNACEVLGEQSGVGSMGNLRDHEMDFDALWNGPGASRIRDLVNRHEACRACTHETMGYIPSLLFPPNGLGHLFAGRPAGKKLGEIATRLGEVLS